MDRQLRTQIVQEVRRAVVELTEAYDEQWLTEKQLCEQMGFFTAGWLRRYGDTLPREQVCVTDAEGVTHKTAWCYPKKKLLRLIKEGALRSLTVSPVEILTDKKIQINGGTEHERVVQNYG